MPTGLLSLPVEISVEFPSGTLSLPVSITVESPASTLSLPVSINVQAAGSLSVPVLISVYEDTDPTDWSFVVRLNGADISSLVLGVVTIDAEEDAARIAELQLFHEGAFDPNDWIANRLEIDVEIGGGLFRLFSGIVDIPSFDMSTSVVSISATDNLQGSIEAATTEQIDEVIPGSFHSAVSGEPTDTFEYMQELLSTLQASFDLDVYGGWRLAAWSDSPDITLTDDDYIADSLAVDFASRRDLVNRYVITFGYRYSHHRERRMSNSWGWQRNFNDYLQDNTTIPSSDDILSAISGTGWHLLGAPTFGRLPPSQVVDIPGVGEINWIIAEGVRNFLAISANFTIANRWTQAITETLTITVDDEPSASAIGVLSRSASYSLDLSSDVPGFADFAADPPGASFVIGSDKAWSSADGDDLADAVAVAVAKAKSEILSTHRANSVRFRSLLMPTLDRYHHVELDCTRIQAAGKVRRLVHTLDTETGAATTDVELAIFRRVATNATESAVTIPTFDYSESTVQTSDLLLSRYGGQEFAPADNQNWTGYVGNYTPGFSGAIQYQARFVVESPEISEIARDPIENTAAIRCRVVVPQNTLVVNP